MKTMILRSNLQIVNAATFRLLCIKCIAHSCDSIKSSNLIAEGMYLFVLVRILHGPALLLHQSQKGNRRCAKSILYNPENDIFSYVTVLD